ncbi:MAG: Nif3-like dinuclear metal center hexameric protein [Firmicutes bacterium]|nr:Nif3-like dinuclear metal center hexameric protein [Bacillota bacterium]
MKINEILDVINEFCPIADAEEWDNSGPQVILSHRDVTKILVSLDISHEVIDEAIEKGAEMILTHHPLIFKPRYDIKDINDPVGSYIIRLIKEGISLYSCHTNFDIMEGGNNDFLGNLLGFNKITAHGIIRSGQLKDKKKVSELAETLSSDLGIPLDKMRLIGDPDKVCSKLCWCTGAGAEYILQAKELGVDLYITGDIKYHDATLAKGLDMTCLDIGHFGSEKLFVQNMSRMLKTNLRKAESLVTIVESKVERDPFTSL